MRSPSLSLLLTSVLLPQLTPTYSKPILGICLGSLNMKVALVQRNAPLEIIVNMHSKRRTEQMILFDSGTRFYGSDASSLIARKPALTPYSMNLLLGRDADHPVILGLTERYSPHAVEYNSTRSGVCLSVSSTSYTPEELVAMILSHAKDITVAHGVTTPINDCVLTVPSFYTQHERRALYDAAKLANLNVLALIDEVTAAGLHFGIDRIDEEPMNVLFYNMGGNSVQVSVIQYHSYEKGKKKTANIRVLGKGWDSNLGGASFDARLVDHMAEEFNAMWNKKRNDGEEKDVRAYPRPISKLKIQASKIKHVLSANNEVPIFIDSLYDDTNYQSHMDRATFEQICHDLILKTTAPINMALKAANLTLQEIDAVELIGGGMRIPKVQEQISRVIGDLDLGMHLNSDESPALGAAFHGANVSTAFKVRSVGLTDINPFSIVVSLEEMEVEESTGLFGLGGGSKKDVDEDAEVWAKQATIFKANGKVGVKKTIAFTQEAEINVAIDYEDSELLPTGTAHAIERYNITGIVEFAEEMKKKELGKPKVSLQFDLSTSGIVKLVKAEAAVEESYTVEEEEEVDVDDEEEDEEKPEESEKEGDISEESEKEEDTSEESEKEEDTSEESEKEEDTSEKSEKEEDTSEGSTTEEEKDDDAGKKEETAKSDAKAELKKKKKKKKTKTITVTKEKKRVHKKTLSVDTYHIGRIQPYSITTLTESQEKLSEMAASDAERIRLEEAKNRYESFIYRIKNKLIDDEEAIGAVSTEEQRDALLKSSQDAEEWMYDEGYDADLVTYEEKYVELYEPAEKVFFRVAEVEARPKVIKDIDEKLGKIITLVTKWETTMPQITAEERANIVEKVDEVKKSIAEKEEAQAAADPTEDPVYKSAEIPLMTKEIGTILNRLSKRPKPKAEKKNETDVKNEGNSTEKKDDAGEDSAEETKDTDDGDEETKDTDDGDKKTKDTEEEPDSDAVNETAESLENEDELTEEERKAEDEL